MITAFLIVAALTCLSNLAALVADRTPNRRVRRRIRFWCQIAGVVLTVVLVVVGLFVQRTAQQATGQRLAGSLGEIYKTQQSEFDKQAQQQQTTLQRLDRTLEQATRLGEKQEEQTEALDQQQERLREVIALQADELKLLNRLPLNRNLAGIEISYTPSPRKWGQIAAAYSKIVSPQKDLEYVDAPMIAENDGDHWEIDFEPTEVRGGEIVLPSGQRMPVGGNKKFLKLSTKANPLFEEVLRKALFRLRIRWGIDGSTVLDPANKDYPSAMYVSRKKVAFILRPPLILWNLLEIDENAVITFFGQDYPIDLPEDFTIRSLDHDVVLDQTIQLNWSKRTDSRRPTLDEQLSPNFSGPHTLFVHFAVFEPITGKRFLRPANKPR